jgi:hypothetical protein
MKVDMNGTRIKMSKDNIILLLQAALRTRNAQLEQAAKTVRALQSIVSWFETGYKRKCKAK